MQRKGQYPPPPGASDIPGLEIAGKVVAVGLGVNHLKIGDEVCALVTGGGYATYCVAPEPQCLPVPKGFSMVEAAAHARDLLHRLAQCLRAWRDWSRANRS